MTGPAGPQEDHLGSDSAPPGPSRGPWLVVTPAFNEAHHLPRQAASLAAQQASPIGLWVVVDDGSSDGTGDCLTGLELPFPVDVLRRDNQGGLPLASELAAFRHGVAHGLSRLPTAHRVMKLDADLVLAPEFFALLGDTDPDLGLVGGRYLGDSERAQRQHVRGGLRAYSRPAYQLSLTMPESLGWDVLDEVAIRRAGLGTLMVPEATALPLRATGASRGALRGHYRKGIASRFTGYHGVYLLLQVLRTATRRPYLVSGLALFWGYASAGRGPFDRDLKAFHRGEQRRRLRALSRHPVGWMREAYGPTDPSPR